ncbi:MAG: hypothetical protein ACRBN8_24845 [Nannocystales bacterium]
MRDDALFKSVFQQPENAAAELQHVLPAGHVAAIDWSTLKLVGLQRAVGFVGLERLHELGHAVANRRGMKGPEISRLHQPGVGRAHLGHAVDAPADVHGHPRLADGLAGVIARRDHGVGPHVRQQERLILSPYHLVRRRALGRGTTLALQPTLFQGFIQPRQQYPQESRGQVCHPQRLKLLGSVGQLRRCKRSLSFVPQRDQHAFGLFERLDDGAQGPPTDRPTFVPVRANAPDRRHVAFHLGFVGAESHEGLGTGSPDAPDRWRIMRTDDNGNEFELARVSSRCEAIGIAELYESRGHKQFYWIEEAFRPTRGRKVSRCP